MAFDILSYLMGKNAMGKSADTTNMFIVRFTHTGSGTDPNTGLPYKLYSGTATLVEVKAAAAAGKVVVGVDDSGKTYLWSGDYTRQNAFVAFFCGAKNTPEQITRYILSWSSANSAWQQFVRTDSFSSGGGGSSITTYEYTITESSSNTRASSIISGKTLREDILPAATANSCAFRVVIQNAGKTLLPVAIRVLDPNLYCKCIYFNDDTHKLQYINVQHWHNNGGGWARPYEETLTWKWTDLLTVSS